MKIAKQIIYAIPLFFMINVQSMAKTTVEKLEKEAWEQAFQGNAAAALETFIQVANNGSWQAAKLLAYNYGNDPLLDQKDEAKAQLFLQLAEHYKKESPPEYFSEVSLESKIEKCKSLQFARINPWYQEVLDILNSGSSYFKEHPTPERSCIKLFDKIHDAKTDKQVALNCMRLFKQTMSQVQSEQTTREIFAQVNDGYGRFRFSQDATTNYYLCKDMIKILEESALKLGLVQEIKTAYGELFSSFYSDYLGIGYKVKKETIVQTIQELFPRYSALDSQTAATTLTYFLENDLKNSCALDDGFLKLLRLLPHPGLEKYITDLSSDDRANVIKAFCAHKDLAPAFQGTVLDFDLLAQKAFHSDLDKEAMSVLIALLKSGNKDFYQKYQDDIIAVLPAFLQKADHEYKTVINLATNSGIPVLQNASLKALVEHIASMDTKEYKWYKYILEKMFEKDVFTPDQLIQLYQLMNTTYQARKCIRGLQLLWMHVKDDMQQWDFLKSSLAHYFNVTLSDASATFENMLQQALEDAQKHQTIPQEQLLQTILIAHETKLDTCIDPVFLVLQKDSIIFDEDRSLQERAIFLDQRLASIRNVPELLNLFQKIEDIVVNDQLKAYVYNILITLNTTSSSFEVCKAKKILQKMHKKYELKGSIPEIVQRVSGNVENFAYLNRIAWERPANRIILDNCVNKPLVGKNGLLYALVVKNVCCSLWAIDGKTLDGVWQVKVHNYEHVRGKEPKFVLHDDVIYLVDGMAIRSFDSKTGIELGVYPLKEAPITSLNVDASGLVYVVQSEYPNGKATVTTIDPNSKDYVVLENNIGSGGKRYFTVGDVFGYYYMPARTITLYSKNGLLNVIETCSNESKVGFFESSITSKNNLILFTKCLDENNHSLVAYDINTHAELWDIPLAEGISAKPCMSSNGQTIFVINKNGDKITAFSYNKDNAQEQWSFVVPQYKKYSWNKVSELAISPDGTTLFALNVYCGDLYTINAHDGTVIATATCGEGRSRYLVGVSDDNLPYIHPVYF